MGMRIEGNRTDVVDSKSEIDYKRELLEQLAAIFPVTDRNQWLTFAAMFGRALGHAITPPHNVQDIDRRHLDVIIDIILRRIQDQDPLHIPDILMTGLTHDQYGEDVLRIFKVDNLESLIRLIETAISFDDIIHISLVQDGHIDKAAAKARFEQLNRADEAVEVARTYLDSQLPPTKSLLRSALDALLRRS